MITTTGYNEPDRSMDAQLLEKTEKSMEIRDRLVFKFCVASTLETD